MPGFHDDAGPASEGFNVLRTACGAGTKAPGEVLEAVLMGSARALLFALVVYP
jgi:hypothetical protein